MNVRFTAWFSERERAALRACAKEMETSENFVVRSAVRQYLGIGKGSQLSHVTEGETDGVRSAGA